MGASRGVAAVVIAVLIVVVASTAGGPTRAAAPCSATSPGLPARWTRRTSPMRPMSSCSCSSMPG